MQMCINVRTYHTMNTNKTNLRNLTWLVLLRKRLCTCHLFDCSLYTLPGGVLQFPLSFFHLLFVDGHSFASQHSFTVRLQQNGATGLHETKTEAPLEMEGGLKEVLDISSQCDHPTHTSQKKPIYIRTHMHKHTTQTPSYILCFWQQQP